MARPNEDLIEEIEKIKFWRIIYEHPAEGMVYVTECDSYQAYQLQSSGFETNKVTYKTYAHYKDGTTKPLGGNNIARIEELIATGKLVVV